MITRVRFERQPHTMRPAVASKRLENHINQWLARRRFAELSCSIEEGPRLPIGGLNTAMAITLAGRESPDGRLYRMKAFFQPPGGPGASGPPHDVNAEVARWLQASPPAHYERVDVSVGPIVLESWVLFSKGGSRNER